MRPDPPNAAPLFRPHLHNTADLEMVSHSPERVDRLAAAMAGVRQRIQAMVVTTQAHADRRLDGDLRAPCQALR